MSKSKDEKLHQTILKRTVDRLDLRIRALQLARDRVAGLLKDYSPSNSGKNNSDTIYQCDVLCDYPIAGYHSKKCKV